MKVSPGQDESWGRTKRLSCAESPPSLFGQKREKISILSVSCTRIAQQRACVKSSRGVLLPQQFLKSDLLKAVIFQLNFEIPKVGTSYFSSSRTDMIHMIFKWFLTWILTKLSQIYILLYRLVEFCGTLSSEELMRDVSSLMPGYQHI